jgi:hypothetical protein
VTASLVSDASICFVPRGVWRRAPELGGAAERWFGPDAVQLEATVAVCSAEPERCAVAASA